MPNEPWNRAPWGPHPLYAVVPVAIVMLGSWIAVANVGFVAPPEQVTAMKPLANGEAVGAAEPAAADEAIPIEVRYGVPAPRTAHLWK